MQELMDEARFLKKHDHTKFFFIYYSGHGYMRNNIVVGLDDRGKEIEIESKLREIAKSSGAYVFAILDCCTCPY